MTTLEAIVVALALTVGAASQAMTGIGLGLVSGAVLTIVLGRDLAIPLLAVLSIVTLVPILVANLKAVRWADAMILALPAVVLTWPFARLLDTVDSTLVARVAGVAIVLTAMLLAAEVRFRRLTGRWGGLVASVLSSFLNVATGTGAPPITLFVVNAGWSMAATRGTMQVYFLALGVALIGSMPPGFTDPWTPLVCGAAVLGGSLIGMAAARRVPERAARLCALALATAGGLALVFA